eukprot:snap_masked-scaffold_19-processed-gene-1.29-mRNA-1 protein AED:1.00 eAED:1.00 QI:0/0/0/0/1/1/3/0/72
MRSNLVYVIRIAVKMPLQLPRKHQKAIIILDTTIIVKWKARLLIILTSDDFFVVEEIIGTLSVCPIFPTGSM